MLFLITYDISNPKRLVRLHRALKKCAMPVQYSVFLARFTPAALAATEAMIASLIDPRRDDVRIYPLPAAGWQRLLGRPILPMGIYLSLLPEFFRADTLPASTPAAPVAVAAPQRLTGDARAIAARARTGQHSGIRIIQ